MKKHNFKKRLLLISASLLIALTLAACNEEGISDVDLNDGTTPPISDDGMSNDSSMNMPSDDLGMDTGIGDESGSDTDAGNDMGLGTEPSTDDAANDLGIGTEPSGDEAALEDEASLEDDSAIEEDASIEQ